MRPRIVNFLVFIYLFVEKGTCTFSVLRTGAITKCRSPSFDRLLPNDVIQKIEKILNNNNTTTQKRTKNGFHNTKKHPLIGELFKPCM